MNEDMDKELHRERLLLKAIQNAQGQFILAADPRTVFEAFLEPLLTLTESKYGFIDELFYTPEGKPYLTARAITDISWSEESRKMYSQFIAGTLNFTNMKSLFGETITSGKAVIANDAPNDPRRTGTPKGHPALDTFLGLPLISSAKEFVGMIGLANRPGGYTQEIIKFLDPLVVACANLIAARRNDQRRLQLEKLKTLDALKTEFFANISHEFRTPLTLMLGPLEDLLSSQNQNLPREPLEVVYRNSLRLLKLVNSLLDFSRLEAGRVKAHYVPTELAAFTVELASHFESAIAKAGLKFVVECKSLADPIFIDREMWEKIVFNLLSNALKFTFEGTISVYLRSDDRGVRLEVSDTGTGIPKDQVPHLFERFNRIRGARSRSHEGSGIGLSLVQELSRLHGGSIEVRSTEGQGSTFIVHIPFGYAHLPKDQVSLEELSSTVKQEVSAPLSAYVQEAALWLSEKLPSEPTSRPLESLAKDRPRILVVDDNADMRQYIVHLLSAQWNVKTANDGLEALDSIRCELPDLILSDIMMPIMNGFELLRELRKDPTTRHLPIILLSARAGEESSAEGIAEGADDYLAKPFSARELVARVNTHLQMSRIREEAARNKEIISRLELEQKWLEATLNLTPIPLLLIEPSTARITFANHAADVMAGGVFTKNVPLEDYTKVYRLTDEEDHDLPVDQYPSVRAARGEKIEGETVVWHSAAGRFTVLVHADILTEMPEHPKTIILAFQDVTALSKAIRSRDEFLSIASHELKTPITSLKMQLQLVGRELKPEKGIFPPAEKLVKMLHIFNGQIDRLTGLVDDLLDVSRIQAGRLSVNPSECNLSKLLRDSIERFSSDLAASLCPLELNIEDGIIGLWDPSRIEQVIANLISNVAKYASGKPVRISLAGNKDRVWLTVQDSGPGIPKEKRFQIFERFERGISARNISGLGLGLFISREIIRAHGGSIDLESDVGMGSTFIVSLPRKPLAYVASNDDLCFQKEQGGSLRLKEGVVK